MALAFTGPLMLLPIIVGALLGIGFGKSFSLIQDEAYSKIKSRFEDAIDDIRTTINDWSSTVKSDIYETAIRSVGGNLKQIRGLVSRKKLVVGKILDESKLLQEKY